MKTQHPHLQVVPPPAVTVHDVSPSWWKAPEFLALAELRRAMVRGAVPSAPAETAEESARQAIFWVLFEAEHLIHRFAQRLEAGEALRIRTGVYKHQEGRVDFNLRIMEHVEITMPPPAHGGPR